MDPIVGTKELERLFDVSRQRVQLITAARDFPAPWVCLAATRVWRTEDVLAWAEGKGRQVHPW